VKARLGTWQVPQLCCPEADKLLSKKNALPAVAAADGEASVGLDALEPVSPAPPPHPDNAAATIALRSHLERSIETIRLHPARVLKVPR
jgi:hypothetical protein